MEVTLGQVLALLGAAMARNWFSQRSRYGG